MVRYPRCLVWLCCALVPVLLAAQRTPEAKRFGFLTEKGRPRSLKEGEEVTLYMTDTSAEQLGVVHSSWVTGYLLDVTAEEIVIDQHGEGWSHVRQPMGWIEAQDYRSAFDHDTIIVRSSIPLRAVHHLTYEPPAAGAGAAICVLSAIGLLIWAPLKGMHFRDGTFSGDRYLSVAKPCLIALGVGLVVMPFTPGKRTLHVKLGP